MLRLQATKKTQPQADYANRSLFFLRGWKVQSGAVLKLQQLSKVKDFDLSIFPLQHPELGSSASFELVEWLCWQKVSFLHETAQKTKEKGGIPFPGAT